MTNYPSDLSAFQNLLITKAFALYGSPGFSAHECKRGPVEYEARVRAGQPGLICPACFMKHAATWQMEGIYQADLLQCQNGHVFETTTHRG